MNLYQFTIAHTNMEFNQNKKNGMKYQFCCGPQRVLETY